MSDIKEGFFPYKEFRYDENQDAYELMSRWTSADNVYLQDGTTNVSTKIESLDETIGEIINDETTSLNATWSSTKISSYLNEKPNIQYKVLYPKGSASLDPSDTNSYDSSWEVDMFEGYFSASRNTSKVVGIIDRWGEAITYITPENTSFVTIRLATINGQRKVIFDNESNVNILVMYIDNGHKFS